VVGFDRNVGRLRVNSVAEWLRTRSRAGPRTGRDPAAVEKHIRELEALSVKRPASTPIFYRFAAARLITGGAACRSRGVPGAQR
jgi:hypothetical protein